MPLESAKDLSRKARDFATADYDLRAVIIKRITRPIIIFTMLFILSGLLIWIVERSLDNAKIVTLSDAYWWSLVTLSTVGFGDVVPISGYGRLIASAYIIVAVVFIAVVVTNIQDALRQYAILRDLGMTGNSMERHVIVCGWSRISKVCIPELLAAGRAVSVVCEDENQIKVVRQVGEEIGGNLFVTFGDMTKRGVLERVNIGHADSIIIATDEDTLNLIASLNIHSEHPELRVIVYVQQPELRKTFDASGVTYVASPFELGGRLVASAAFEPEVALLIDNVSSGIDGHDIQQFTVPEGGEIVGTNVDSLRRDLLSKGGPLLIATGVPKKDGGWAVEPNPSGSTEIKAGMILIVLGHGDECSILSSDLGMIQGR